MQVTGGLKASTRVDIGQMITNMLEYMYSDAPSRKGVRTLTRNHTSEIDSVIERYRPISSHPNTTRARNGHDCKLPVWVGFPVALNPHTGKRAEVGLIVHCEVCDALWEVIKAPIHIRVNGPDLLWIEQRRLTKRRRKRLMNGAIDFSEATAYAKPDPAGIDWSVDRPRRPNGMHWWQMDFEEMRGYGDNRCESTSRIGHGPIGGLMTYFTHQCVLKKDHAGSHESPDPHSGAHGWSG
jgi:hypothetical protein